MGLEGRKGGSKQCQQTVETELKLSVLVIEPNLSQFSTRVFEVASTDLVNMGVMIISYTIKDITDEVGYLAVSEGVYVYV